MKNLDDTRKVLFEHLTESWMQLMSTQRGREQGQLIGMILLRMGLELLGKVEDAQKRSRRRKPTPR